jgi:hypothetical protein
MKKINHLGVKHRVPLDFVFTSSPPQPGIHIKAALPDSLGSARELRSLESRKPQ